MSPVDSSPLEDIPAEQAGSPPSPSASTEDTSWTPVLPQETRPWPGGSASSTEAGGKPAPARRRRGRRAVLIPGDDERASLLNKLARRAFPTFEFFLFSLLCGAILGAGYLLDAHSLLVLAVVIAPLCTPWVGMTLATTCGAWRFFFQSLAALLVGAALAFLPGLLAGIAARLWLPLPLVQAHLHARLWWPNLFVLALGAISLILSFVRSEEKPILPSIMLVYELYLPLGAAAFGLGAGLETLWPAGILVYAGHLALATFLGIILLFILRFRPRRFLGYGLSLGVSLAAAGAMILVMSGLASLLIAPASLSTPTPSASLTPTATVTPSSSPLPTKTLTPTIPPSPTRTPTTPPSPTPFYARVQALHGNGTLLRAEPGNQGAVITSLLNGYLVEILPEKVTINNVVWVKVFVPDLGVSGWLLQSVLATATPVATP